VGGAPLGGIKGGLGKNSVRGLVRPFRNWARCGMPAKKTCPRTGGGSLGLQLVQFLWGNAQSKGFHTNPTSLFKGTKVDKKRKGWERSQPLNAVLAGRARNQRSLVGVNSQGKELSCQEGERGGEAGRRSEKYQGVILEIGGRRLWGQSKAAS